MSVGLGDTNPSFPGAIVVTVAHRVGGEVHSQHLADPSVERLAHETRIESEVAANELISRFSITNARGRTFGVEDLLSLAKRVGILPVASKVVGDLELESFGYTFAKELPLRVGASPPITPASTPFVANRQIGSDVFRRESAAVPVDLTESERGLVRIQTHLLTILGYRRSELFTPDLHLRLYTVALPPCRIYPTDRLREAFLVYPLVHLVRRVSGGGFRRLFSVSLVMLPRDCTASPEGNPRPVSSAEIDAIHRELTSLTSPGSILNSLSFEGPLKEYLSLEGSISLGDLVDRIIDRVRALLLGVVGTPVAESTTAQQDVTRSRIESCILDANLEVDWPIPPERSFPWEDWLVGKEDPELEKRLFRILRYQDSRSASPHSTAKGIRLRNLSTNDDLGLDTDVLQLFDPQLSIRLMIQHQSYEGAVTNAVVWSSLGWYLFTNVTLASLREVIRSYHSEIESQASLASMLRVSRDFLDTIDEFYDLDIRQRVLKMNYEKARKTAGLDSDYRSLREAVAVLESEMAVDSTFKLNKLIFAFTIVNVSVVLYELVASRTTLPISDTLALGLLIAALVGPGAYLSYDRIGLAIRSIGRLLFPHRFHEGPR